MMTLWLMLSAALAHPLAPSALRIDWNSATEAQVVWHTPAIQPSGADVLQPLWSLDGCTLSEPGIEVTDEALITEHTLSCPESAAPSATFRGLDEERAGVLVTQVAGGQQTATLVRDTADVVSLRPSQAGSSPFTRFLSMGAHHLWIGADHMLLLFGLIGTLGLRRRLVWALTGFTVGHSLTLVLTTLRILSLPALWAEAAIAASLLWVALPMARGATEQTSGRSIWWLPMGVGAVHGLGFAGVLGDLQLDPAVVPSSLLGFNLGLELGQLAVVAGVALLALLPVPWQRLKVPTGLVIGTLAVAWTLERVWGALG